MAKFILEDKVIYDSSTHSLFEIDRRETQTTLAIPASLCLLALLQNKDETVSLNELHAFAWQSRGINVSTNAIYQNLSILRKQLVKAGLSGDVIKTVPKRGFVILSESFLHLENENTTDVHSPVGQHATPAIDELPQANQDAITPGKHKGMLILLFVTVVLSLLGFEAGKRLQEESDKFIYPSFSELTLSGSCHIHRNQSLRDDAYFYDFLAKNNFACGEQKWWYIFNYPPASKTLVLRCSSDLLSKKGNDDVLCSSDYYF
ncbi:winged helix-turn-helix domain-containing protein [Enterobacter cloacae]